MALVLTVAPAEEPVTVDDAKAHLRVGHADEDVLIASLIATSRLQIEAALGLALITQSWTWWLDSWPAGGTLELPLRPVQSVEAVRITGADASVETLAADRYLLDGASLAPRLIAAGGAWPRPGVVAQGIEIAFTAGFGSAADAVPAPIRRALLMLVAHWYENREPGGAGNAAPRIPDAVSALLMPYRRVRL
jgi:uncharacterized phiE125 gp8 family phage protein